MFGNVNMICAVNLYVNMESILLGIKSHAQRLIASNEAQLHPEHCVFMSFAYVSA